MPLTIACAVAIVSTVSSVKREFGVSSGKSVDFGASNSWTEPMTSPAIAPSMRGSQLSTTDYRLLGLATTDYRLPTTDSCFVCLRLLSDDVDQIPHREIDVDEVQSPVGEDVGADADVARDVVDARIVRIAVHGDLEVVRVLVRLALRGEQPRHAHPRRVDPGLGRRDPRLRRRVARDRLAARVEI